MEMVIDKIKSGYYDAFNASSNKIKNELKKDLLAEHVFASEEIFEFAWKWGTKSATETFNNLAHPTFLNNVFECFMDLLLIKNG